VTGHYSLCRYIAQWDLKILQRTTSKQYSPEGQAEVLHERDIHHEIQYKHLIPDHKSSLYVQPHFEY